jgi:hypothetical protein
VDASSPTGGGTTKNYGRGGSGGPHLNDWRFNTSMACHSNRPAREGADRGGFRPPRARYVSCSIGAQGGIMYYGYGIGGLLLLVVIILLLTGRL